MAKGGIKGIVLQVSGDTSGLVSSLDKANKEIKDVSGSLSKVNQALKLDPSNVTALEQKQALLAQAISATKDKLDAEKQAAEQAAKALQEGTITQGEYNQLQAEVALTSAKLGDLEKQAGQTASKLDTMGNDADTAAKDEKKVGDNADKASKSTKSFGDTAKKAGDVAKKAFTAAAAAASAVVAAAGAVGKKGLEMANEVAEAGDKVDKQSQKLGLSAEKYQELSYVLQLSGTSIDVMTGGMKKLTANIEKAQSGNKEAIANFEALGVSLNDLATMDREDILMKTINGFQGMEDTADRASLATTMLGKSGSELAPLFNTSAEATQEMIDKAHQYGMVMDDELVKSSADYENSLNTMKGAITGVKNDLVGQLLPGLTSVTEGITRMINDEEGAADKIGEGVKEISTVVQNVVPAVVSAIQQNLPTLLTLAGEMLMTLINGLLSVISDDKFITFAVNMISSLINTLLAVLPQLIPALVGLIEQIVGFLSDPGNLTLMLDAVMAILDALVNGISELIPILLPACVEIINTISLYMTDHLDQIIAMAVKIIVAIVSGLIQATPKLIVGLAEITGTFIKKLAELPIQIIPMAEDWIAQMMSSFNQPGTITSKIGEVISTFLSTLGKLPGQLISNAANWGRDMMKSFVDGFKNAMGFLKNGLSGFGNVVKSFLHFSQPDQGPLSGPNGFETYGPDMVETFADGIDSNLTVVKKAMVDVGTTVADNKPTLGYSGALNSINGALAGISGQLGGLGGQQIVIPVSIGGERLDTIISKTQNNINYRSGGH